MAAPLLVRSRWFSPARVPQRRGRLHSAGRGALPYDLAGADGSGTGGKVQGPRRGGVGAQRDRAVGGRALDVQVAGAADGLGRRRIGTARGAARIGGGGRLHGRAERVDDQPGGSLKVGRGDRDRGDAIGRADHVTRGRRLLDEVGARRQAAEAVASVGLSLGGADHGVVAGAVVEHAVSAVLVQRDRHVGQPRRVGTSESRSNRNRQRR